MRMAKTINNAVGIMIARAAIPTRQSCIRRQLHHPKRARSAGVGVSMPACTDERVHVGQRVGIFDGGLWGWLATAEAK